MQCEGSVTHSTENFSWRTFSSGTSFSKREKKIVSQPLCSKSYKTKGDNMARFSCEASDLKWKTADTETAPELPLQLGEKKETHTVVVTSESSVSVYSIYKCVNVCNVAHFSGQWYRD